MSKNEAKLLQALLEKTGYLDIFTVLYMTGSAHLSHIARLIDKSKSTTLKTIDYMLEENPSPIEVDIERTLNTRGVKKFYKLTEIGAKLDLMMDRKITEEELALYEQKGIEDLTYRTIIQEEATRNYQHFGPDILRTHFNLNSHLNYLFQRASTQSYLELLEKVIADSEEFDVPYGTFHSMLKQVKVSDFTQVLKIRKLALNFQKQLQDLEEEIDRENQELIKNGKLNEEDLDNQLVFLNLNPMFDG